MFVLFVCAFVHFLVCLLLTRLVCLLLVPMLKSSRLIRLCPLCNFWTAQHQQTRLLAESWSLLWWVCAGRIVGPGPFRQRPWWHFEQGWGDCWEAGRGGAERVWALPSAKTPSWAETVQGCPRHFPFPTPPPALPSTCHHQPALSHPSPPPLYSSPPFCHYHPSPLVFFPSLSAPRLVKPPTPIAAVHSYGRPSLHPSLLLPFPAFHYGHLAFKLRLPSMQLPQQSAASLQLTTLVPQPEQTSACLPTPMALNEKMTLWTRILCSTYACLKLEIVCDIIAPFTKMQQMCGSILLCLEKQKPKTALSVILLWPRRQTQW